MAGMMVDKRMHGIMAHYDSDRLLERVVSGIQEIHGSLEGLDVDDLAVVDSFHMGGRGATRSLASWVGIEPGWRLLDVGAGPGGTARFLADRHGASVTGVDLTPGFVALADRLSEMVGMGSRTRFVCGSALALPFEEESFHCVWMEHVQMNIRDKEGLVRELYRVLKPGGTLALYEVFQAGGGEVVYPVPWAGSAGESFLVPADVMKEILVSSGFAMEIWVDWTRDAAKGVRAAVEHGGGRGGPLLMGERAGEKLANLAGNLEKGCLQVIQAVARKV